MKILISESQVGMINDVLWAHVEKGEGSAFDWKPGDIDNAKKFLVPLSMMIPNQTDDEGNNDVSSNEDQNAIKDIINKIKKGGSVSPILLHKIKDGFLIVDGHHRYAALKQMGKKYGLSVIIPSKNVKFVKDFTKSVQQTKT